MKKKEISQYGNITWQWLIRVCRSVYRQYLQLHNQPQTSILKNIPLLSATSVLSQRPKPLDYNTTSFFGKVILPTIRTIENVKTDLDVFVGRKWIQLVGCQTCCSRKRTTATLAWSKTLQWKRQISTSSCDWGISWSLQRKSFVERKTCPQCETNNVQRHGWTTQTTSQREWRSEPSKQRFAWLCCGTMWTSQQVHTPKSDYLPGRRRTRSLNKLSMWIIKLKNLSIYLM